MKTSAKIAVVCLPMLAAGGWLVHSLFAAQARPGASLAQAPMNTQVQVPPAFIMAVDDSGSMMFQTQFPSRDGGALWDRDSSGQPYSFFYSSGANKGKLRQNDTSREFVHVAPYPAPRQGSPGSDNAAIPPIDAFGFSRSPEFNPAYFNPSIDYQPWVDHLGNAWDLPDPTDTRVNPRDPTPTVDLTAWRRVRTSTNATHHAFRIRTGMVLPEGTEFYDSSDARGCGLSRDVSRGIGGTNGDWRELQEDVTVTCSTNVYIGYFPATFYLRDSTPAPTGYKTNARVLVPNACSYRGATGSDRCDMYRYEIKPGNYTSTPAYNAAIQNFANWFSFYGNRNRAMVAGMTRSLAQVNNMSVGYFTINQRNDVTMRDMADPDEREALFDQLVQLPASGNTPNLPAVKHLGDQFKRSGPGAPIQLECQRNAGMLFTDGFSNVGQTASSVTDLGAPFDPTPANSLAAIASSFYFNSNGSRNTVGAPGTSPLRSDLTAGRVPVPQACSTLDKDSVEWKRLDCQSNLHMNFYGVTLGSRGVIFDPDNPQDPYVTNPSWPGYNSNQRSTIDDIWHATVNTRGEFINARTPADIVDAMRRILTSVSGGANPSGTLALTGARIGAGSLSVAPHYEVTNEGTDWFGKLTAYSVGLDANRQMTQVELWEAGSRMPGHTTRSAQTFVAKGSAVHTFSSANVSLGDLCSSPANRYPGMARCNASELEALGASADSAVRYLMGDTSLERRNGGSFRDRSSVLGDIVNSTPVVSSPRDDYGYRALAGTVGTSYADYLEAKESRSYMVYVGANDGMLHAFHGGMNAAGTAVSGGGTQRFAYVPATALGHMGNLLFPYDAASGGDQKFDHRYYVDGPVSVSDVCASPCTAAASWSTALVGTAGAGGRSVFALDVSNPGSFGASDRLWEINDLDTGLAESVRDNIGFVLGKPVIVPVKIGTEVRWKAIFGNGYNSRNGKAVLFVVDLSGTFGASSVRMIEAEEAGGPPGVNGLGNIVAVDRRGATGWVRDGYADTVYAADQKGAVWKFDLLDTTNAKQTVPLFTTKEHTEQSIRYRQPITGGMTAATGPGGGVMLFFGTGSFSFVGDPGDTTQQSLYAVNDVANGAVTTTITRTQLVGRSVQATTGARGLTNPVDVPLAAKGWYVDLAAGERFVANPRLASGVLFMPTYIPQVGSSGCSTSGLNWLFGLNARTGAAGLSNVRQGSTTGAFPTAGTASLALNTPGTAPIKDVAVNVLPRVGPATPPTGGGGGTPPGGPGAPPSPPAQGCWMTVSVSGLSNGLYLPYPCGRQSWRQLQ